MDSVKLAPGQRFGADINSIEVGSFRLSERAYSPRYSTPTHSHARALFCFVVSGSYTETYGTRVNRTQTRSCPPATLLFHPAEEIHTERFHENGGRSLVIELDPGWFDSHLQRCRLAEGPTDFRGGLTALIGRRLYKEFREVDDVSPLIVEGLMLEMIGEISRRVSSNASATQHVPGWLKQARELVRDRFAERLTLSCIAQEVGVHPTHLSQMFHRHFCCTVGEYIRRLRIEYACQELAASDTPLATIALEAGFCDQSHFTRTFKRLTGVAPSEYRTAISK